MTSLKRFLKDWCRDCKTKEYMKRKLEEDGETTSYSECHFCLYQSWREVEVEQPCGWSKEDD